MTEIEAAWTEILNEGRPEPGWHARRVRTGSSCEIRAALLRPGDIPALLFTVGAQAIPVGAPYPGCIGFLVEPQSILPGPTGQVRICLMLKDVRYRDVFAILAEDIASVVATCATEAQAVRFLLGRLNTWRRFVLEHGTDALSQEAQVGLAAELLFLEAHVLPVAPADAVVRSWRGPHGAPHDIELPGRSLEIKASTSTDPSVIRVSNLDQLESMDGQPLSLVFLVLEDVCPDGLTLPEIVARLRMNLSAADAAASMDFDASLLAAGYSDVHARHYAAKRYRVRAERWFDVRDRFPRLTRATVPSGVVDAKYVIRLADCTPFERLAQLEAESFIEATK